MNQALVEYYDFPGAHPPNPFGSFPSVFQIGYQLKQAHWLMFGLWV